MNRRSPYVFEYSGSFLFEARLGEVWNVLERFDAIAGTWPWVDDLRIDGDGLRPGTVLRGVVNPPVPYRMRLDVEVDDCDPQRCIVASVHGDLEGCARFTFDSIGDDTRANAVWTIEMMQAPMRVAARVAPRLLRWGHDRVVAATVAGLRRHLEDDAA